LVIGVYAYIAHSGFVVSTGLNAANNYYNLLVQGFRAGQLSLKKEVPPGFAQLADPYDRTANAPYGVLDLSYYQGKFYLYHGVTPAVVLFWPYAALTGHYLSQKDAGVIFCVVGFLASMGLLCALWRRYFAEVSVAVVAAGTLALGLATFTPLLLARCDVHEVSISCGYALTMLALAAIWKALHAPSRRGWWLAAASLAYGLAVGARPSLLFGAVILLATVAQAWRERQQVWPMLAAATVPITLIGLGLMLYNDLRFDNPLEFGLHYQLTAEPQLKRQFFNPHFLWFNFQVYFLEPACWSARFPFVHEISVPPRPADYAQVGNPFGILTNIPLVWLALVVPLSWWRRMGQEVSTLRWFMTSVVLLFGTSVLPLLFFESAIVRYEVDFLPALVLLAVVGMLGLERALADRLVWRRAARWGWGLVLGFSVAFNLLASLEYCAEAHDNLGGVLAQTGKIEEAIAHYEQALRLKPDYAEAHYNLGIALWQTGRVPEAIVQYEQALRVKPDLVEAQYNLGMTLAQTGKIEEAIPHFEQALRIKPDDAEAHYNLGVALAQTGKIEEAIAHYEQALHIKPDYAEAHNNLGIVLLQEGKVSDAIRHYEQALRSKPDYAEAHDNLGVALAQTGKIEEAIAHYEQAMRIKPDDAEAHYNLGLALEKAGRMPEAIEHYQQTLKLRPDLTAARNALTRLQAGR
jgi:tetratricopeptide (TPR) repeat protein